MDLQTAIERVRQGRGRRGWAAAQLAAQAVAAAAARGVAIDLTQQAVSYFENGKTKVVPPWVQYALAAIDGDVVLRKEDALDLVPLEEVDLDYGLGAAYGDTPVSVQVHQMPRQLMDAMSDSPSTSLFVTRGVGDSMQPIINHGDLVIIDRSQRVIGRDDGIWALAISGMHTIKRVRIRGDQVRLLSPNPDVSDDIATTDEVYVIGKVVFVGRRM